MLALRAIAGNRAVSGLVAQRDPLVGGGGAVAAARANANGMTTVSGDGRGPHWIRVGR